MTQQQFTKDGHTVTVSSARAAVALRFDGWIEQASKAEPEPAEDITEKAVPEKTAK